MNQMNKMNTLFWILAIIYIAVYIFFIFQVIPKNLWVASLNLLVVLLLVLLPPLFYGFAYFVCFKEHKTYIKELSEIWGPFWAASSALLLTIYNK